MSYSLRHPETATVHFKTFKDMSDFIWNFRNSDIDKFQILHDSGTEWKVKKNREIAPTQLTFEIVN